LHVTKPLDLLCIVKSDISYSKLQWLFVTGRVVFVFPLILGGWSYKFLSTLALIQQRT